MVRVSKLDRAVDNLFVTIPLLFKTLFHDPETLGHDPMSTDFRLLAILMRRGPLPISKTAKILAVSKSNMTKVLNKLIEEGRIESRIDSNDKLVTMIEITNEGILYLEGCMKSTKDLARQRLQDLKIDEREAFFSATEALGNILTKINEG